MLRPLHNASLSDISTPLNISDISTPTQPNNAIIGICILKSPRFQINRLRTTPIKQQINDLPSFLFSTHTPKPAPERAAFQQNPRRTTQTKTGQTDRNPAQNHTTGITQHSHCQKRASNVARNAKSTTISRPNHLSPARKKRQYQPLFTAFSNSFMQTYNISVKQGKNDSIFV